MSRSSKGDNVPRGDGTGPAGMGPMTGRAAGYCSGSGVPGYANRWSGRGRGVGFGTGMGWGRGRGWGWRAAGPGYGYMPPAYPAAPPAGWGWYGAPQNADAELSYLKAQAETLSQALANIQKRIESLEEEETA